MLRRPLETESVVRRPRGRKRSAGALLALGAVAGFGLAWGMCRMRRDRRSPALDATILQIREACRWDCDDVVPLVLAGGDIEHLEREWPVLHAELIDLEARVEATAVRAADPDAQRALDRTWSALIALRSALEAHVRLRLGPVDASQSSLIEPLARTVGIRRDDLRVVAAALPAPLASSGDSPVSGSRDL